jgi:hypothetical protein
MAGVAAYSIKMLCVETSMSCSGVAKSPGLIISRSTGTGPPLIGLMSNSYGAKCMTPNGGSC